MHVPAEAQARRPLWLGLTDVRLARSIVVDERVVADAEVQQQVRRDLPVVHHVSGTLRHAHGGGRDVDVLLHVIAARHASGVGMALRRRRDIGWDAGIDTEYRLAAGACAVDPLITRPRIQRAVAQIPGVDIVDADLEVVRAPLVLETQAVVCNRFAMIGVGDRRIDL